MAEKNTAKKDVKASVKVEKASSKIELASRITTRQKSRKAHK